jgi:hypothetical protein
MLDEALQLISTHEAIAEKAARGAEPDAFCGPVLVLGMQAGAYTRSR